MTAKPSRPNLLLITVDAWRADFVDDYAGVALTPTVKQLLPQAVRFDHAYTAGPWTSPGLISLFCGRDAAGHGIDYEWSTPPPDGHGLVAELAAAGYETPNLCYLNRVPNYHHLGYDPATAPDYPKSPDDELLLRTLRELRRRPAAAPPWFLWYHYKFVHLPYWPAEPYRRLFGLDAATEAALPAHLRDSVQSRFVVPRVDHPLRPEDRELVQRMYAGGVRQMDHFLGRVVEELAVEHGFEQTTLVLTADHGDELLEHGHVGHASTAHFATLYEEVLRIPLLIVDPRRSPAVAPRSPARVQLQDLYPTLLSLAGVTSPASAAEALDLSPLILGGAPPAGLTDERWLYFHSSVRGYQTPHSLAGQTICGISDGRTKLIWEQYEAPRRLLFDLLRDPGEQAPITSGPAVEAAHQALLHKLRRPSPPCELVARALGGG